MDDGALITDTETGDEGSNFTGMTTTGGNGGKAKQTATKSKANARGKTKSGQDGDKAGTVAAASSEKTTSSISIKAIAGQIPGNGNQGRVLPSNTRGIARYLVIPVFEVPDGRDSHAATPQRRPRASASSIRFFVMPIAIAHGPRRRVTKHHRAQL